VRSLTVNTQASNHRSQRLYLRYGFERNGYDLGVWQAHLSRAGQNSSES
jgi:RimJ/RimL family protein N-acetyltransferase